ncbi:hypothetical protein VTO73DRAFT_9920 [Trametes versicolor]
MSQRGPPSPDMVDHAGHNKRGRMDIDDSYGQPGGGGSGGGHFGGFPPPPFSSPGPAYNYGPNYGPGPGPNYGPGPNNNYGPGPNNYGPPQSNYSGPSYGPESNGWERAADAYKELADARQKYAELANDCGVLKAKEADLRARIRERDRALDEAGTKLKGLREERDTLLKEVTSLRAETQSLNKEVQHLRRGYAPTGPRFVPPGSDGGWDGAGRGRTAGSGHHATTPVQPPTNAVAPTPANTTTTGHRTTETSSSRVQQGPPNRSTQPAHARAPLAASRWAPQGAQPSGAPVQPTAPTNAPPQAVAVRPAPQSAALPTTRIAPQSVPVSEFELSLMTEAEREAHHVLSRQGQVDTSLEASGQPLSAWYLSWISPPLSMAESFDAMDHDAGDDDESDDGNGAAPGLDLVFPDPISSFANQLTTAAHTKEVNRAARARGMETIEPLPSTVDPEFGAWSGTTIETVVQAQNLRWWALVEWDEEALRFLKFVGTMYQVSGHVRPEGIRFLQKQQSADAARRKAHARKPTPRPVNAPRMHLGRYPEASADIDVVWRFFRCAEVSTWPTGMRLASGAVPPSTGFSVPLLADCRAFFLLWHLLPLRSKKNPHHEHDARIRALAVELFSIPGWYERVVAAGEFIAEPQAAPVRYPYSSDDASHVLIAAWFCTHGVGLAEDIITSLRRWALRARNITLEREVTDESPWPAEPASLAAVTGPAEIALVVKYHELAWGSPLLETHETNHGDFDELDDGEEL